MNEEEQILALCVDKISAYLGVKMFITKGGPSCSDPAGTVANYVAFCDKHGSAIALKIDCDGHLAMADNVHRN